MPRVTGLTKKIPTASLITVDHLPQPLLFNPQDLSGKVLGILLKRK